MVLALKQNVFQILIPPFQTSHAPARQRVTPGCVCVILHFVPTPPDVPFVQMDYIFGVTPLSVQHYFVAMIPRGLALHVRVYGSSEAAVGPDMVVRVCSLC